MKYFFYKALANGFYYLGDILCRFDFEWSADLYQKVMKLSLECDEKIGYELWKEPVNRHKDI